MAKINAQESFFEPISEEPVDYLALPTRDLLDSYGAGSHIPGSGSAAVLSAMIAVEMMRTVIKLTLKKPSYQSQRSSLEFLLNDLEQRTKPRLIELFRLDIDLFNDVSTFRLQRDSSETEAQQRHWDKVQRDTLEEATKVPIEVAEIAIGLMPNAFYLFDEGYRAVRGDSGVAVSNLLSAISGALFIIFLNLRSFQGGNWLMETRNRALELSSQYRRLQGEAFERVLRLYNEGAGSDDAQLTFDFFSSNETVEDV